MMLLNLFGKASAIVANITDLHLTELRVLSHPPTRIERFSLEYRFARSRITHTTSLYVFVDKDKSN